MDRDGYLIIVEQDMNKLSPTYLQKREREEYNPQMCPSTAPIWVLINSYCQEDSTGQTGYRVDKYVDTNPNSETYSNEKSELIYDIDTCPIHSSDPDYQYTGNYTCEIITYEPSGVTGNSGASIQIWQDMNEFSSTFGTQEERRIENSGECPIPNTDPEWVELNRFCILVDVGDGQLSYTGMASVEYQDKNLFSPTWDEFKIEQVYDENCPKTLGDQVIWGTVGTTGQIIDCTENSWTAKLNLKLVGNGQLYEIIINNGELGTIWHNFYEQEYELISSYMRCGGDIGDGYDRGYVFVDGVKYENGDKFTLTNNTINLAEN
jgi:hypothetical protein